MPISKSNKKSEYVLNAVSDKVDIRDRFYEPALIQLEEARPYPSGLNVLDQGLEGACTGFALAAVINLLHQQKNSSFRASARMLYEMARKHDEWEGEDYSGSSCRGAIKGWYNMGVCSDRRWPYINNRSGSLSIQRAKEAQSYTIGAYYRVRPDIVHFHAALNEVGALYVSADVHTGWKPDNVKDGVIKHEQCVMGGHAFALVGYDETGFWVQNSWSASWGLNGIAHWSYEDWKDNIKDAWVFRLALPTPQIFPGSKSDRRYSSSAELAGKAPARNEIMGHFVHLDDGRFDDKGRYWSNLRDVKETSKYIAKKTDYKHLLIYAHGGLNSVKASANRIKAMKDTFMANEIYPYHFMYDTGLLEEIKDVVLGKKKHVEERAGSVSDVSDWLAEKAIGKVGTAVWKEMKRGASSPFANSGDGVKTIRAFIEAFKAEKNNVKIHLVGHSTGGVLLAYLIQAFSRLSSNIKISSVSLMAPANTVKLFEDSYLPLLRNRTIEKMKVYNLSDKLERDDTVVSVYRKSLLYLVSNAFEDLRRAPLLGMEKFSKTIQTHDIPLSFIYSQGDPDRVQESSSKSHGGFDNDPATMNDILKNILCKTPTTQFTEESLRY